MKISLTIEADPDLVKARSRCYGGRAVTERRECPLCGETMRLREHDTVVRVPGNPTGTARRVREWVCPECDYFEEAEDEGR
jgi:hypothetical protein